MASVKPIPDGYSTVISYLSVKGANDAIAVPSSKTAPSVLTSTLAAINRNGIFFAPLPR